MLKFERGQRGVSKQWCKYCNVFVPNNQKCINDHNNCITHTSNVARYEKSKESELRETKQRETEVDMQLCQIRKKAEEKHLKVDIMRDFTPDSSESKLDEEMEMAKLLYGEDFLGELLTEPQKPTPNRASAYNSIMQSLPSSIPKKHKQPVRGFRD